MGLAADEGFILRRQYQQRRGRASPRAQCDKKLYQSAMKCDRGSGGLIRVRRRRPAYGSRLEFREDRRQTRRASS